MPIGTPKTRGACQGCKRWRKPRAPKRTKRGESDATGKEPKAGKAPPEGAHNGQNEGVHPLGRGMHPLGQGEHACIVPKQNRNEIITKLPKGQPFRSTSVLPSLQTVVRVHRAAERGLCAQVL